DQQQFDAAGRLVQKIENYVESGGSSDENRTTLTTYTPDGAVATLTAVNAATGDQVTTYVYGTTLDDSEIARSDLLQAVIYPDSVSGSDQVTYSYNRQGQVIQTIDQNGTTHAYLFDLLGRPTDDCVKFLGTGIDGSVCRISTTYEIRGLVAGVASYDNATPGQGNVVNDVEYQYNQFQQLIVEYQSHSGAVNTWTSPKVGYNYLSGGGNSIRPTGIIYPNGRTLTYSYGTSGGDSDQLSRIEAIIDSDGTMLVQYTYLGLGTFVQADYPQPQVRYDLITGAGADPYAGLDQFGRVIDCLWYNYNTSTDVVRVQYGYDQAGNRIWRADPVAASQSPPVYQDELYTYDGLYQLTSLNRGQLNSDQTAINSGTLAFAEAWEIDPTGNWARYQQDD
ncbi:MAG TPA: hypothetical protein VIK18_02095, partial [Pirellulales bacterium]